nr:hypothetical protein TetV2_00509 [Oceanusvirus sp.]
MEGLFESPDLVGNILAVMAENVSHHATTLCMIRMCSKSLYKSVEALDSPRDPARPHKKRKFQIRFCEVRRIPAFIQWMVDTGSCSRYFMINTVTPSLAGDGNIHALSLIRKHLYGDDPDVDLWDWFAGAAAGAARTGNIDALRWVSENLQTKQDRYSWAVSAAACRHDRLEALKWMHKSGFRMYCVGRLDGSISGKCLETIKWCHEINGGKLSWYACDEAVRRGNLEAVKWIVRNDARDGCEGATECEIRIYHIGDAGPRESPGTFPQPCCRHSVIASAMCHGQTHIARWAIREAEIECSDTLYDLALQSRYEEKTVDVLDMLFHELQIRPPRGFAHEAERLSIDHISGWARANGIALNE